MGHTGVSPWFSPHVSPLPNRLVALIAQRTSLKQQAAMIRETRIEEDLLETRTPLSAPIHTQNGFS